MKKKLLPLGLCILMITLLLSACGNKKKELVNDVVDKVKNVVDEIKPEEKSSEETTSTENTTEKSESKSKNMETNELIPGNSQSDALPIPFNTKIFGTLSAEQNAWFAFTTGSETNTTYNITFVNTTADVKYSPYISGALYYEYGTVLFGNSNLYSAEKDGVPKNIRTDTLEPNTTYYVCLSSRNNNEEANLNYSIIIKNSNNDTTASKTTISFAEETTPTNDITNESKNVETDELIPGNSQSDALLIPLNTKMFGTLGAKQNVWFAFTTGNETGATYNITFVNATSDVKYSPYIFGALYDEYGTMFSNNSNIYSAEQDGIPKTISTDTLEPNTTYYVCLSSRNNSEGINLNYSLIIKNPNDKTTAYKTKGNFTDARGSVVTENESVTAGTNINDAVLLSLGTKVRSTVSNKKSAWYSFTTGQQEGATYNATFVNNTADAGDLHGYLFDEYGTELLQRSNRYDAENNGIPKTLSIDTLEPNTTYYVLLRPQRNNDTIDYSIMVKSPDAKKTETNLVFETPFEINDTQIQFVAEKAIFVDEAQAKKVLEPVANAILEHPKNSVLIAGTTATDGKQASRVQLSNKRAAAVKNLLTTVYNVPESQLKTVGLGYEADPFERGQDRDSNGNFVESEGRKNRRVVVLDADDPIAKEILKNN